MDEIEQMVLIDKLIWVGGLAAPVIIGVAAVLIARQPEADRVRVCFVGAVAAFALGTVGSYAAGETILTKMDRVTHLPRNLFLQAWHRMWYPLGIGVLVGFALTIFALYPKQSEA